MVVTLPPLLESWVNQKVSSGMYGDVGEVIREAVRRMAVSEGVGPNSPSPMPATRTVPPLDTRTTTPPQKNMKSRRFDEADREVVVHAVGKHCGVSLQRSGHRKIALRDGKGRIYWVLGGYGDWHGIPVDLIDGTSAESAREGVFVLAKRMDASIRIFHARLSDLLGNVETFGKTELDDQRQFDLEWSSGLPTIKQCPSVKFSDVGEVPAPTAHKPR